MNKNPTLFHPQVQVPARLEVFHGFSIIMASPTYPIKPEDADGHIDLSYRSGEVDWNGEPWLFKILNQAIPEGRLNMLDMGVVFQNFVEALLNNVPTWARLNSVTLKGAYWEASGKAPLYIGGKWGYVDGIEAPDPKQRPIGGKPLEDDVGGATIDPSPYFNIWASQLDTASDHSGYIPDWIRDEVSFWLSRLQDFPQYDKTKIELAMALWFHHHEGTERHLDCIERELPTVYALYTDIQSKGEPYVSLANLGGLILQQDYNNRIKCHNILTRVKVANYDDDCQNPQALMASMYAAVGIYGELSTYTWDQLGSVKGDINSFCRRFQAQARDQLTDVPKKWD